MNFLKKGKETELEFSKLFESSIQSTKEEDIRQHWDVAIDIKFDVKGLKKISRTDESVNENIHWLEIKNVNGELGWVYGQANYFVFETHKYWILVDKEELQTFIKENIVKEYSKTPTIYNLYTKEGRKDVLTLIPTLDLCAISSRIIKKIA